MKSLITGSNGAAAYYLSKILDDWHPLSRPDCDLANFDAVCERLDEVKPDVIFHLASDADVRMAFDHPQVTIQNNIMGTVNLFESCRKVGIKPVIEVCSSSEVYGNPGRYPIDEAFPMAPVNPYAVSKCAQDLLGGMYETCYGFRVIRTRSFGYVNPRRFDLSLSSFARQIVQVERGNQQSVRHGNLDSVRTFCDVRDIAKAYKAAAETQGVYNIGSEVPVSIGECLEILCSHSTVLVKLEYEERRSRPYDVTNQIPDCAKFRRETGWQPEISLEDSLKWLLNTCRQST